MALHDSFIAFFSFRLDDIQKTFQAAIQEISRVIFALDAFVDAPPGAGREPPGAEKVRKALRDFQWWPFSVLDATASRRHRQPVRELRSALERTFADLSSPSPADGGLRQIDSSSALAKVIAIRAELNDLQCRSLASLARWRLWARVGLLGALTVIGLLTLLFTAWSGIATAKVQSLSPMPGYNNRDGEYYLPDDWRELYLAGLAREFVGGPYGGPGFTQVLRNEVDEEGRVVTTRNAKYEHLAKIELFNQSFVQSQFISTLDAQFQLQEAKPFPWSELRTVFAEPAVELGVSPGDPFGAIRSTSFAPTLLQWSLKLDGVEIDSQAESLLQPFGESRINLRGTRWGFGRFSDDGQLKTYFAWSRPVPYGEPAELESLNGLTRDRLLALGLEVKQGGTPYELQATYETLAGDTRRLSERGALQQQVVVFSARDGKLADRWPQYSIEVINTLAAAIVDYQGPAGESFIRADLRPNTLIGSDAPAHAKALIDRHLAARGRLAVYAGFQPAESGVYDIFLRVNGEPRTHLALDVIVPDRQSHDSPYQLNLVERFRFLQRQR